ncbi:MAG: hypothetical protein F9K16_12610 [Thermoanaerobaculia bacterium]|nr:MAG: hypothetical protein F9K16_12610 [Thermoanaerobaculia bacterium]MBZ0102832.1 hypothetical protein [Thermoanaerobaculia bacterium]
MNPVFSIALDGSTELAWRVCCEGDALSDERTVSIDRWVGAAYKSELSDWKLWIVGGEVGVTVGSSAEREPGSRAGYRVDGHPAHFVDGVAVIPTEDLGAQLGELLNGREVVSSWESSEDGDRVQRLCLVGFPDALRVAFKLAGGAPLLDFDDYRRESERLAAKAGAAVARLRAAGQGAEADEAVSRLRSALGSWRQYFDGPFAAASTPRLLDRLKRAPDAAPALAALRSAELDARRIFRFDDFDGGFRIAEASE